MLKFIRPDVPDGFEAKALKKRNEHVSYRLDRDRLDNDDSAEEKKKKKEKAFDSIFWGDYKDEYFKAQFRKCGYCEAKIAGSPGDMEHYRPKAIVHKLSEDVSEQGIQQQNTNRLSDRKLIKECQEGYWWLAYSWDNYLLACSTCNTSWKKTYFPIEGGRLASGGNDFPSASPVNGDEFTENPLLLNPFDGDFDPVIHFEYTKLGMIKAKSGSTKGVESIRSYGLDRIGLNDARFVTAKLAYDNSIIFSNPINILWAKNSENILKELGADRAGFSGMVRIIFESVVPDMTWKDFIDGRYPGFWLRLWRKFRSN